MRRRVPRGMRIALPAAKSWDPPSMIALPYPSSMTSTSSFALTCSATSCPGGHANSVAFRSALAIPHSGPVPELPSRSTAPSTANESSRATVFALACRRIHARLSRGCVGGRWRSSSRICDHVVVLLWWGFTVAGEPAPSTARAGQDTPPYGLIPWPAAQVIRDARERNARCGRPRQRRKVHVRLGAAVRRSVQPDPASRSCSAESLCASESMVPATISLI